MRVLAVASSAGLGGAELALVDFLAHRPAGVDAQVLTLGGGPLTGRLEAIGVPVRVAPGLEGRPSPRKAAGYARALAGVLADLGPDLVWAVGIKAASLSLSASRARGVPIVWHKVDFSHDRLAALPLAAGCNGVVTVSDAAARALGPLRGRRHLGVAGIPVGLPAGFRAEPDPDRPAIGTLARLVPYKGQDRIIAAAALLKHDFPALRVVLAGPEAPEAPGYPGELRRQAGKLGLDGHVEMPGFVPASRALLPLSVYVSATHRSARGYGLEGLGAGVIEAQWAGIPVVVAPGGGAAESLVDGTTGILTESADPVRIAEAAHAYLSDPELARRAGEAGRAFARERFAPDVAARRLFAMLERAARPYRDRSPQRSRS